jgi:hypothetical protein
MALIPPFATVADLEAGWRPLTTVESTRANQLLMRASQVILDEDRNSILTSLTVITTTHIRIVCSMVARAIAVPVDQIPMTQVGQTAGPFSTQSTFSNPGADLYLTKAERRQLGFGRMTAGGSDMWTPPVEVV